MPRLSLRTRLVASLVILLAGMSLAIGAASVISLDRYLSAQLHAQLTNASRRTLADVGHPAPRAGDGSTRDSTDGSTDDSGPGFLLQPGQAEGTIGATVQQGRLVRPALLDPYGRAVPLRAPSLSALLTLPADGVSRTLDLGSTLGDYLVVANPTPDGDTAITGLPTAGITRTLEWLTAAVTLVSLIGLLLAAAAGTYIVTAALRPLRRMAATAARVAELPLERGDVALAVRVPATDTDPRTEVGQVGAALNRMLGHVAGALQIRQASEARTRRFVADASHELRTPLASVRGYAELVRRRGDDLPPEVLHALRRVESEAVRMTGLVEDLLLLARLDESALLGSPAGSPAGSLRRDRVDLSAVVVDCVSDAHLLAPTHRWLLDLPDEPSTVIGDAARLRQVLTNLLANARIHTPPGTTISVRLQPGEPGEPGEDVLLEVLDDGPGIPAALLPEVFDRFTRADSSRSRAAGSTGLGLSIVASVVQAHGGHVEVTSVPGRTAFTVHLPGT